MEKPVWTIEIHGHVFQVKHLGPIIDLREGYTFKNLDGQQAESKGDQSDDRPRPPEKAPKHTGH